MSQLNPFAISSLCVLISTLIMTIFVFLKGSGKRVTTIFGWISLLVALWGFCGYQIATTNVKEKAFFWYQIAYIAKIFIPPLYVHFVFSFLQIKKDYVLAILYTLGGVFLFYNFFARELFLGDLRFAFGQFYVVDWPVHKSPLWLTFFVGFYGLLFLYAFYLMLKYLQQSTGLRHQQMRYFITASIVGWIGGQGNFFIYFGGNIYPWSNFLIGFYPVIMGYAMVRHRLFNMSIIVKKSLGYSLLISCIYLTLLVLVIFFERLSQGVLGYTTILGSIGAALIIGMMIIPVRNRIQHFVDKLFYKGTQSEIAEENELLLQEVSQTDRYKTLATLIANIVEGIKNPLTSLKAYGYHLPNKLDDKEFLKKFAKIHESEVSKINNLIELLKDYSHPAPPSMDDTDVLKLLNDTIDLLKSNFFERNIQISKNFEMNKNIILHIDSNQIRQAFLNIIMNSVEAMEHNEKLWIEVKEGGGFFQIIFKDTGCGIDAKELLKIFDPFFSLKEGHTGLGLSIAQGIMENHRGKISVKSEEGSGTEVIIELPLD